MRTITVTGGNGRIGGAAATLLAARGDVAVRVFVRNAARARETLPDAVTVVTGDMRDAAACEQAVDGADALLLVSPVDPAQRQIQGAVVRAAAANGRHPHVVKVSGLGTALDSPVDSGRWHAETEADIAATGLPYTFLRPNFFMQNLAFMLPAARSHGVIRAAVADARIAMVDVRDIADLAVAALADGALAGQAVTPTEARTRGYDDVAALLTALLERPVRYQRQTLDEVHASIRARGEPEWHERILMQFNRAFLDGAGGQITRVVEDTLGRPPRSLESFLREAVAGAADDGGKDPFPT